MGWLSNWNNRKSHIINAATGAGTNYQKMIIIHYGAGSDSGIDVYLNSKCRTDFGDIRFTDDDGTTELSYWRESKTDSDNAVFWVKINDSLESDPQTIYVYYGKADATYPNLATEFAHGEATFLFFDDFNDESLDTSLWNTYGSPTESGGRVTLNDNERMWGKTSFTRNVSLRAKGYLGYSSVVAYAWAGFRTDISTPVVEIVSDYVTADKIRGVNYTTSEAAGTANIANIITETIFEIAWTSVAKYYANNTLKDTISTQSPNSALPVNISTVYASSNVSASFDWVLVRKYVDTEPTDGAWGDEEEFMITITYLTDVVLGKINQTKSYLTDAYFKKETTKTYVLDILNKFPDALTQYLINTILKSFDSTKTYSINTVIQTLNIVDTYIIDMLLATFDITKTYSIDSIIKELKSIEYNFDVLFQREDALSFLLNVLIQDSRTSSYLINVLVVKDNNISTYLTDFVIIPDVAINCALDAIIGQIIRGITKDSAGQPLGNCTVWLFRTNDKAYIDETTSDVNGVYYFVVSDNSTNYFIRADKDGSPNVFGTTDKNLVGES